MQFFKHKLLILSAALCWSSGIYAQSGSLQLDSLLNRTIDSMRSVLGVKSLGAAVIFPNDSVWARSSGFSTSNPATAVSPSHLYEVGSVAKTFTAACVLQLVDEGVLSLNDSLHEWLDTIPFINPNITIRQLLRHQSGIYDVITNPDFQPATITHYDSVFVIDSVVHHFINAPLFQPGAFWSYSNTNYLLLAMIVRKATAIPYHEQYRTRFFEPWNLPTIQIPYYDIITDPVAHVWLDLNGDNILDDGHDFYFNWISLFTAVGPSGGYFATPTEIARWMKLYAGGALLSPDLMTQVKTTVNTGQPGPTKYGLGIMDRKFMNVQGFGHGGDLGYSASVFYFPAKNLSIAVLNNDSKQNSWALAPVITALMKTYMDYNTTINVEDVPEVHDLEVFAGPNPFMDRLQVQCNLERQVADLQLQLTDTQGKAVAVKACGSVNAGLNMLHFDQLSGVPAGFYALSIMANGQVLQSVPVMKF